MGCYSCGGNPNTFCRDCTYPKDTWIAPVDSLPDPFMGDFDHLFRTPDGNMYALAPDRSSWILMGGAGGAVQKPQNLELNNDTRELTITRGNTVTLPNDTQNLSINGRTITISNGNAINLPEDRDTVYNDAELRRRIQAVEDKADNFVSGVTVSREGNKVKLTYTFVNGAPKEVEFEDKDTVTLAYDDTALKARVKALENKPDKDTIYDDSVLKARIADLEARPNSNEAILERVRDLEAKQDRDNQNLTLDNNSRVLTISNGNNVTLPNDKQTIRKEGNKLILSNGGGEVELPQPNNSVSYDDSSVVNRLNALERIKYKDKDNTVYPYTGEELVNLRASDRAVSTAKNITKYKYDSSNNDLTEPFIENVLQFDFLVEERNSITGENSARRGNGFNITRVARQFEELYNEEVYSLTLNTSLLIKLNTIWKDTDKKFTVELGMTLIYKEQEGDFVREYRHNLINDEIDSREPAYISVQEEGVEKGYSRIILSNLSAGMSNFGYRVYKQDGANNYTKLETING